jgi:hypothetical protein
MDIKLDIKYRLELNRDEWLVVSKALRAFAGDLPRDDAREVAATLQEQMVNQKASVLDQMAGEAQIAAENVLKAKRAKP